MIDYGLFHLASAPRTGTTWVRRAADLAGLRELYSRDIHTPFSEDNPWKVIRLACVRHPCDWLASYYVMINPGHVNVPQVDQFRSTEKTFDEFVRRYLDEFPGAVGRMLTSYNAESYLRIEDLPSAFVEFLEPLGVARWLRERCLECGPDNITHPAKRPRWNKQLKDAVVRAEVQFLERFEYWW
jgi:hypothetical protein